MRRSCVWLFAAVVVMGTINLGDVGTATAGRGFRLFRGRTYSVPRTYSTRQPVSSWRKTSTWSRQSQPAANGPRIKGRHDWPGAIGAPPANYQFFQDVNGYWR
ncbi:hypothetical protein Mal15_04950 [Stieleria maiorica]|uniref:Secreted protein n=1 Tax=Stieleria maiorica TaxID=2795974 RepID=A0A5B9MBA6_9BACT|nr:hypothetical protein [Stieleria maiorica]QEF96467.1 hypothetical protein Mal15_04950 [Stieleria maiorica]